MIRVSCSAPLIAETLEILRRGGSRREERVVLWLAGPSQHPPARVVEVYEPEQITAIDSFELPPHSMRALMAHLATSRRRIVAQIHTHPGRAFHSKADDEWAIIRHAGALSLVLPRFAAQTTTPNFLDQAMIYEFSPEGQWVLTPGRGPEATLELTP